MLQTSLDDGESEAITLSLEMGADLILLDDSDARERARVYGFKNNRNPWYSFTCKDGWKNWFFKRGT